MKAEEKRAAWAWALLVGTIAGLAAAQNTVKADQGRPGNQGPWPVTMSSQFGISDGGSVQVFERQCSPASPHRITVIDGGCVAVPATMSMFRFYIRVDNTLQNNPNVFVKCRADGTCPIQAAGNAGDYLEPGDGVTYWISGDAGILCTSNATANVTSYECN